MRNDIFKKIIEKIKKVVLQEDEKTLIKGRLLSFMEKNPAPINSPFFIKSPYFISSKLFNFSLIKKPMRIIMVTSLVITLLTGGSFSYAAEQSLPGDALYPIKVEINEEIRGIFISGSKEKAIWEIERTERRLQEAAELVLKDKMTSSASEKINNQLDKHADKIDKETKKIEVKNPKLAVEIHSQLETSLGVHTTVLLAIKEETKSEKNIDDILSKTYEKTIKSSENKNESKKLIAEEGGIDTDGEINIQKKIKEAEKKVNELQFVVDNLKIPASKTFANDIDEKLAKIQELKGKVDKEPEVKDNDAETFLVLQKINQKADELSLLLSLKDEIRTSEGLSNSLENIINDVGEVIKKDLQELEELTPVTIKEETLIDDFETIEIISPLSTIPDKKNGKDSQTD
ncbi:hypothetical protein A2995_00695 [Candidatus Nomurabacteria bacterium RIFCSPLOWO2_01_FULL_33_24]|uniref:DUF5667 domain-containing protein n=1 Tax=Candidatus Nomurabacteria bacterium RIFCSPLOWO2_01_FULL_33_24 TaxID=1801765 RepID=A0A1F6X104_9BACT|nr:MAG: hypothetical protein A2995_00695 [Candidatus Nomurabacteria bacterium RIFCSPLOWO2_01_FULL_33_24]